MKKLLILITILVLNVLSCKEEVKNENKVIVKEPVKEEVLEDKFIIQVDITMPKDDFVKIYYWNDVEYKFSERQSKAIKIKGSDKAQKVVFEFPAKLRITNFRLDLGANQDQGLMFLEKITVNNNNKSIVIDESNIFKYLIPNAYLDYIKENGAFRGREIDNIYAPYFNPKPELEELIFQKL